MSKKIGLFLALCLLAAPVFAEGGGWEGIRLNGLVDVDKTLGDPTDGQGIAWDDTFKVWKWEDFLTSASGGAIFLKLNQATHQHVINDYPRFDAGLGLVGNYGLYWRDLADANTIAYISYDGDLTMRAVTGDLKFVAGGGDIDFDNDNLSTTGTLSAGVSTLSTVNFGSATGVSATAAAGVLTMAGIGGTNNETLLWDFETTSNRIKVSSSTSAVAIDWNIAGAFQDNRVFEFGTGQDAFIGWITDDTNDGLKIGTICGSSASSGNILIIEKADKFANFGAPAVADPHLRIQSSDATTTSDFIQFYHDQTNANINIGNGALVLSGGHVLVNTTDDDGTPATGQFVIKGSTNDGSTNIFVGRDSDEANVAGINTDGEIWSGGDLGAQLSSSAPSGIVPLSLKQNDTGPMTQILLYDTGGATGQLMTYTGGAPDRIALGGASGYGTALFSNGGYNDPRLYVTSGGSVVVNGTTGMQELTVIGDQTISDSSPNIVFRDSTDDTAYCFHLDTNASASPFQGLTLWRGTDTGGLNSFGVNPDVPLMHFDTSNTIHFNNKATLDTNGNMILAGSVTTIDPTTSMNAPTRRYSNSLFTKKDQTPLQTPYDKTILDNFDALGNWTVNYGGTAANDTTNYKTSSQSIKVTSNTGVTTAMSKTVALDMSSSKVIFLRFYVDNVSNLSNIGIYLSNDDGYANFFQYFTGATYIKTGWNTVAINREDFSVGDGAPSWASNIVRIRLVTIANASGQINISYDELSYWTKQLEKPVIIFTFDDGQSSVFAQAKTMLDAYGWAATAFVYPSGGIGEAGYMTTSQLRILQDLGWDISNHSYDHTDLTTLTADQIDTQMENCVDWLRSNGFTNGARFLAYPFGGYNSTVETEVSKYCDFARTVFDTIETYPIGNPYRMRSKVVTFTDSLATIEGYVDDVITNNGVLVFTFHNLVASPDESTEWGTSDFASLLAYIDARDIDVLTLSQFVDRHKGTYPSIRTNSITSEGDLTLDPAGGDVKIDGNIYCQTSDTNAYVYLRNDTSQWIGSIGNGLELNYYDRGDIQLGYNTSVWKSAGVNEITMAAATHVSMPQYGAGTATFGAGGVITSVSDERLKDIQGPFTGGLKEIEALDPITYKWKPKEDWKDETIYVGFSAQNVQKVIPEAVGQGPDGMLSLSDRGIIAALVNAVKEQQAEIDDLKARIDKLENK